MEDRWSILLKVPQPEFNHLGQTQISGSTKSPVSCFLPSPTSYLLLKYLKQYLKVIQDVTFIICDRVTYSGYVKCCVCRQEASLRRW